jgi:hypothetical protein
MGAGAKGQSALRTFSASIQNNPQGDPSSPDENSLEEAMRLQAEKKTLEDKLNQGSYPEEDADRGRLEEIDAELGQLASQLPPTNCASTTNGASAASTPPQAPNTSVSTLDKVEDTVGVLGTLAEIISILESGGTIAKAGVGTTMGALLLPIGAFFLGTAIREQIDKAASAKADFKMKIKSSALADAAHSAAAQVEARCLPTKELNNKGVAAVKALAQRWKDKMDGEADKQLTKDEAINHSHPEDQWQALYDGWVQGMAEELVAIYTDPSMTK